MRYSEPWNHSVRRSFQESYYYLPACSARRGSATIIVVSVLEIDYDIQRLECMK